MAGDAFSRFKTQVLIFFSVTVKKKFDTNTREGRARLGYFAVVVGLLLVAVLLLSDSGSETTQVVIHSNGIGGGSRGIMFEEDEEDEEGDSRGGLEEEDEDEEGGRGEFDEEDEDGESSDSGSAGSVVNALKGEQQARQTEMKASFTKFFEVYSSEEETKAFIGTYESKYKALGIIKSEIIGKTYEKRDMFMYTIGKSNAKKHIVVLGSEHGAEWSVPTYLTYLVTRLVQLYGINDEVTQVLDSVQIHVLPYMNPDGHFYSTTSKSHDARHYQKNKAPVRRHSSVKGVDLREDWSHFSQLETSAVRTYLDGLKKKGGLAALVNVACCGSFVASPRNQSCITSDALEEQESVGKSIAREMHITNSFSYFQHIKPIKHSKIHSDDFVTHWAENTLGLNLAYTLSAAPASVDSANKRKKVTKVIVNEKKLIEIPEKDLLIGSREITKGVVALGKHLSEEMGHHPNALCDAGAEPEPVEEEEEEEAPVSSPSDDEEDDEDGDSHGHDMSEEDDESEDGEESANGSGEEEEEEEEADERPVVEEEEGEEEVHIRQPHTSSSAFRGSTEGSEDFERHAEMTLKFAKLSRKPSSTSHRSSHSSQIEDAEDIEPFTEAKNDVANALRFARTSGGVSTPLLENLDQATIDGTGDHFLYFTYGPDMLYELLYSSGVTSAVKVVNAQLDGYGFDYTYYSKKVWKSGVADIYKKRGGYVLGVIYRVDKSQRGLLDRHNLASSDESHVAPLDVIVSDRQGNAYPCVTYHVPVKMAGEEIYAKYKRFKPSRQYRNCVIKGAKQHHFSEDYIEKKLRSISPLFSDKIGSTTHRNPAIGTVCDATH